LATLPTDQAARSVPEEVLGVPESRRSPDHLAPHELVNDDAGPVTRR
jgi:hypothetical protein